MKVTIPDGQKCQHRPGRVLTACDEDATYGLVATPGGGVVMYLCAHHADELSRRAEDIEATRS